MGTTRKKRSLARDASDAESTKPKKKRAPRKRAALAPETTTLFAPVVAVEETDIVVDEKIPRAPRRVFVHETDIVAEDAIDAQGKVPDVALVHVPRSHVPRSSRKSWFVAGALALAGVALFATHHHRAPIAVAAIAVSTPLPALVPAPAPSPSAQLVASGHAAFAEGQKLAALRRYERALAIDHDATDPQMIANLVACYGARRTQPIAAALIVRFQLSAARDALMELAHDGRTHGTRAGARYTLEKLRA